MDWHQVNKDLGLPTHNAQGLEIRAGEEYLLIGSEGLVVNATSYLMVGYEDGKAQLQDADGFKFLVRLEDLSSADRDASAVSSEIYLEAEKKIAARKQEAADQALKLIEETFHPRESKIHPAEVHIDPETQDAIIPKLKGPYQFNKEQGQVLEDLKRVEAELEPYRKQVERKPPERIQDMIKTFTRVRDFKFHPGNDKLTYTLADMIEFVKHCDRIRGY